MNSMPWRVHRYFDERGRSDHEVWSCKKVIPVAELFAISCDDGLWTIDHFWPDPLATQFDREPAHNRRHAIVQGKLEVIRALRIPGMLDSWIAKIEAFGRKQYSGTAEHARLVQQFINERQVKGNQ